ncbi:MAG: hypothetical protein EZS28_003332 [Streblomastix strix]|uniref:Uncharacterized protein n=1 Tax=Streblomastix strix TaxID=222440 RepID=A0A5J4X306_9EUKA|nr:MAG: hypothetical protein EZS28_003332 [Streblomastix strix]
MKREDNEEDKWIDNEVDENGQELQFQQNGKGNGIWTVGTINGVIHKRGLMIGGTIKLLLQRKQRTKLSYEQAIKEVEIQKEELETLKEDEEEVNEQKQNLFDEIERFKTKLNVIEGKVFNVSDSELDEQKNSDNNKQIQSKLELLSNEIDQAKIKLTEIQKEVKSLENELTTEK